MKKLLAGVMATALLLAGCSKPAETTSVVDSSKEEASSVKEDPAAKSEGVMSYAEYEAAKVDDEVTVEGYVQAKQSYWEDEGKGKATLYLQDLDGAYFVYNINITEDDYKKMAEGQKVQVKGYKTEFNGEVEIDGSDASYTIEDGNWVADAEDLTDVLGNEDEAKKYMNQKFSVKGYEVVASDDGNAFTYNYDGSGTQGDDLYFKVSDGTNTMTFTVESYLTDSSTDVYKAVEALKVGDKINAEGFLYWYEGINPHITSLTVE